MENLSPTRHYGHMATKRVPWLRWACLFIELVLIVGAMAAPLVFSSAVLANFLAILEAIARAS